MLDAFKIKDGRLAQLGEHRPYKAGVTGSSPVSPTIFNLNYLYPNKNILLFIPHTYNYINSRISYQYYQQPILNTQNSMLIILLYAVLLFSFYKMSRNA
jgi:hypothetical protein